MTFVKFFIFVVLHASDLHFYLLCRRTKYFHQPHFYVYVCLLPQDTCLHTDKAYTQSMRIGKNPNRPLLACVFWIRDSIIDPGICACQGIHGFLRKVSQHERILSVIYSLSYPWNDFNKIGLSIGIIDIKRNIRSFRVRPGPLPSSVKQHNHHVYCT